MKSLDSIYKFSNKIQPIREKPKRKYIGKITYDSVTKHRKYIEKILLEAGLDKSKYFSPAITPGNKLHQFIFTVRKMRNKLSF